MNQNTAQELSLFFFFTLLDEQKAIEATSRALNFYESLCRKNNSIKREVAVISASKMGWESFHGKISRGRPNFSRDSGWLIPENIDLAPWQEFQKSAQEDELMTVVWSKILNITDQDIAEGAGISIGTVRHRVGRAVRRLGSLNYTGNKKPFKVISD